MKKKTENESKQKRLSVALDADLHEKLRQICYMQQITIADAVKSLVTEFVKSNKKDVTRYNKIFGKNTDADTAKAQVEPEPPPDETATESESD